MAKFHEEPHFDVIPFKESPEKFYGGAKKYARQEKPRASNKLEEDKSYEELADEVMTALR